MMEVRFTHLQRDTLTTAGACSKQVVLQEASACGMFLATTVSTLYSVHRGAGRDSTGRRLRERKAGVRPPPLSTFPEECLSSWRRGCTTVVEFPLVPCDSEALFFGRTSQSASTFSISVLTDTTQRRETTLSSFSPQMLCYLCSIPQQHSSVNEHDCCIRT